MADLIKIPHYLLKTEGTFIGKRNGSIQTRIKDDLYKKLFQMLSFVFVFMFSLLLMFNTATADIDYWVLGGFVFPRLGTMGSLLTFLYFSCSCCCCC